MSIKKSMGLFAKQQKKYQN